MSDKLLRREHDHAFPLPGNAQLGMTLREYFAGQAMTGLLANPNQVGVVNNVARESVMVADALIAELERTR